MKNSAVLTKNNSSLGAQDYFKIINTIIFKIDITASFADPSFRLNASIENLADDSDDENADNTRAITPVAVKSPTPPPIPAVGPAKRYDTDLLKVTGRVQL